MKNTLLLSAAVLFFSAALNAQSTSDSIAAKYQLLPMPQALTIEKTFPAIGTYQLNNNGTTQNVVVSLDQDNKGVIWIEGLPEGKMKAYMKKGPATYRILPQKTESGKQIPEGTLIYNQESNTLNVAIGKPFDTVDPSSVFNLNPSNDAVAEVKVKNKKGASKTKTRLSLYSAVKTDQPASAATLSSTEATKTIQ